MSSPERAGASDSMQTPRESVRRLLRERAEDPWRVHEIEIPMRDGVMLAADLYAPAGGDPAPAIVLWTPYDKSDSIAVAPMARRYQREGYAFVAVDCRGRGKSEGEFRAWVNDGGDGYDTVQWVAAQSWCDGAVGTTGASYCGWAQWATAMKKPPSLRCMVSSVACGHFMEAMPSIGGCPHLWYPHWCYALRHRIMADVADVDWNEVLWRLPVGAMIDGLQVGGRTWLDLIEHDRLDDFWRALRFDGRYSEIEVPVLHVTGWWDYSDAPASFHHYLEAVSGSSARQRLIVGPWSHEGACYPDDRYDGVVHGPEAVLDMDAVHLRFFESHLRGGSSEAAEPGALFFITGANVWRAAERWPLPGTQQPWHLDAADEDEGLRPTPPDERSTIAYVYDPDDPVRTAVDFALDELEVRLDQTECEHRADVLTFTSAPLSEPLLICGIPRLELLAATDGDDTDWHVKLTEVDADGRSMRFTAGRLRASCADDLATPTPVKPGEARRYEIALDACTHELQPGHRLRLSVTSSDFPWFARNPNRFARLSEPVAPRPATSTVFCGSDASRLLLPVPAPEPA